MVVSVMPMKTALAMSILIVSVSTFAPFSSSDSHLDEFTHTIVAEGRLLASCSQISPTTQLLTVVFSEISGFAAVLTRLDPSDAHSAPRLPRLGLGVDDPSEGL